MGSGISLLFLALGTIGGVGFLALAARKQVANLKGDPGTVQPHQGSRRRTTPEHAGDRALKPRRSRLRRSRSRPVRLLLSLTIKSEAYGRATER